MARDRVEDSPAGCPGLRRLLASYGARCARLTAADRRGLAEAERRVLAALGDRTGAAPWWRRAVAALRARLRDRRGRAA